MPLDSNHHVILAGTTPGVAVVQETCMVAAPTLAGYVRKTCEQVLGQAEVELAQKQNLPESVLILVRELRVAYLHASDGERDRGTLVGRFSRVLDESRPETAVTDSPVEGAAPSTAHPESEWYSLSSLELAALCRTFLIDAESAVRENGALSLSEKDRLYRLRDAYNDVLGREAEQRGTDGDEGDDGDAEVFKRLKVALGEVPRSEEVGRSFSQRGNLKMGETTRGGTMFYHRKH